MDQTSWGTNKIQEAARWEDWEDQIDPKPAVGGPKQFQGPGREYLKKKNTLLLFLALPKMGAPLLLAQIVLDTLLKVNSPKSLYIDTNMSLGRPV